MSYSGVYEANRINIDDFLYFEPFGGLDLNRHTYNTILAMNHSLERSGGANVRVGPDLEEEGKLGSVDSNRWIFTGLYVHKDNFEGADRPPKFKKTLREALDLLQEEHPRLKIS